VRGYVWAIVPVWLSVGVGLVTSAGCTNEGRADVSAYDTYQRACSRCHGPRGQGGPPATPGEPGPRDFTDAAWQRSRTTTEIEATVRSGKGPMPAFGTVLSDVEIEAAVSQVRSFGEPASATGATGATGAGGR
jgi:mono/diheme cytochrome c family protein